ncbi:MAG: carboxypeptidase regulatory-like domain-containing protein [Gemmatimonadaceae bacterium]|nr:carboxypeptidase regulatory-like domain-containing protein [Gemmatimonadaceae bacterium]
MRVARTVLLLIGLLPLGASAQRPVPPPTPLPMPASADAASAGGARVSGSIVDSLASKPLASAVVQIVSATDARVARTATTDVSGQFVFDGVAAGRYLLGVSHPSLDSLGVALPLVAFTAGDDDLRLTLGTPSALTLRRTMCGGSGADVAAVILARVRGASDGLPRVPAQVRATWTEVVVAGLRVQRIPRQVVADANDDGLAVLCDVPLNGSVTLRAWAGADSSGFAPEDMPTSGLLKRDLLVAPVMVAQVVDTAADSSTVTSTVLQGTGILRGVVRRENGGRLRGARVQIQGGATTATTDEQGRYRLTDLPLGTHQLTVRAVGFVTARVSVDVLGAGESTKDIVLAPIQQTLSTVTVTSERLTNSRGMMEFERRRKAGFGTFFDEKFITEFNPTQTTDLFRFVPGATVQRTTRGNRLVLRGADFRGLYCEPTYFVDGLRVRLTENESIDDIVPPKDIQAVEAYVRTGSVPVQFQSNDGCGTIVIWTGGRRNSAPTR